MAHQDIVFVVVSVALAVIGSFAALVSAIRIPLSTGAARARWIVTAALALGGGAIWSMHFIGMIGYQIDGLSLTYDLPLTGLSLLIAVAVSALGLAVVGANPRSAPRLLFGGVVAGLGVAAMHYTGMAALRAGAPVSYRPTLVVASVGIAIFAALAALAIAFRVEKMHHVAVASVIMAVAVCGMHYTAMAATQVAVTDTWTGGRGADPIALGLAVCVVSFSILALVIFAALGGVTDDGAFQLAAQGGSHRRGPDSAAVPDGRVDDGVDNLRPGRHSSAPPARSTR